MSDSESKEQKPRNFNEAATSWDEEPRRVRLAAEVAEAVKREVALRADMDVLDYGCGTGLVSLLLQPLVRSVTGADTSEGMLEIFRAKVAAQRLNNVQTVHPGTERESLATECFDLVVSSMTLHHIEDLEKLVRDFYRVLRPGGVLAVADLDSEDGSFHGHGLTAAHSGFDREWMRGMLVRQAFWKPVRSPQQCWRNRMLRVSPGPTAYFLLRRERSTTKFNPPQSHLYRPESRGGLEGFCFQPVTIR